MIRRSLVLSALSLVLVSMILVPAPVGAQSGVTLYVNVNPTTVTAGEWAAVSGVVVNNTGGRLRTTVTFTAYDPCGTKTDLGYNRLALAAGQSVLITTAYPTKASSCRGTHTVTIAMPGKGATVGASATTNLEVQ
jgi:hypothetical protein